MGEKTSNNSEKHQENSPVAEESQQAGDNVDGLEAFHNSLPRVHGHIDDRVLPIHWAKK